MNTRLENWKIVEMNYSLLNKRNQRKENSLGLRFRKIFSDKNKFAFKIVFNLTINDIEYDLNIEAMFNFKTDEEITEDFKNSHFPKINAPAIAYPYLRAYVSNLTLQSGVTPVMLPTINFIKFENPED